MQHFVGPLDPARYELELLAMNAQTSDPSKAEKVSILQVAHEVFHQYHLVEDSYLRGFFSIVLH